MCLSCGADISPMCGRFARKEKDRQLAEALKVAFLSHLQPRYNIAPSQLIACVRSNSESKERECVELNWGLVPFWAKDLRKTKPMSKAMSETAAKKAYFRKPFKSQRLVILSVGFYEWDSKVATSKQPYYFRFKDKRMFCFAGL